MIFSKQIKYFGLFLGCEINQWNFFSHLIKDTIPLLIKIVDKLIKNTQEYFYTMKKQQNIRSQ